MALFWDEITTITPSVAQPYRHPTSMELFDAGILVPYRAQSNKATIMNASYQISELLDRPDFESIIGSDHWTLKQSMHSKIHPDKIEGELLYALQQKGKASNSKGDDGYIYMEKGLAAAYMLFLAVEIASQKKCSLVTDQTGAFRIAEEVRLHELANEQNPEQERQTKNIIIDECISEMILTWFRVDENTSPKKVVKFREKRKNELLKLRTAIFNSSLGILPDKDPILDRTELREWANKYVHDEIQPAYRDLEKTLQEEKIDYLHDTLEAALKSENTGFLGILAGIPWAVIAAPLCSITLRSLRHYHKRKNRLLNSPWSYLYQASKIR